MASGAVYLGNQLVTMGTVASSVREVPWGNITGTLSNQTDLQEELDDKQDKLVAGEGISIDQSTNTITSTSRMAVTYWDGN